MGHPVEYHDELHRMSARQLGKTKALAEDKAREVVRRWRRAVDGLCYRMVMAPLVPMLLSERLLLAGPRAHGEFPDRREQVRATAVVPARLAVIRMRAQLELDRAAAEQEEADRADRVATLLDDGTGAKAGELLLPGVPSGR